MFNVTIRDHIMIAHSLPHSFFGPAQQMHGATYVIDAKFSCENLDPHNVVIDIGYAHEVLRGVCEKLNYQNLDNLPEFEGKITTTEFLAHYIHNLVAAKVRHIFKGKLSITLGESHIAWAGYEGLVS